MLTVTHEYSGFVDSWQGNGKRWSDNAGCLFTHYDGQTTIRECVDGWVDDFMAGGDCDSFPEDITEDDVRAAILDSFSEQGRSAHYTGARAECAIEYAENNACPYCGGACNDEHSCDGYAGDIDGLIGNEECPVWIILVEHEFGTECAECENAVGSPHHSGCGKLVVGCPMVVSDDC